MFLGGSQDESSTVTGDGPLSNQSKMISKAMRKADQELKRANYMFSENMRGAASINEESSQESSSYADTATIATARKSVGTMVKPVQRPSEGGINKSALNLRSNDTQFHIIAELIVSKYDHLLQSGAHSYTVSVEDKKQLDRMVSRDNFVNAVRFRLESCPEHSQLPIHIITRKCQALGLHHNGNQNPLYAPAGTVLKIENTFGMVDSAQNEGSVADSVDGSLKTAQKETFTRQQLQAELRDATNLMAESVTPEAVQFWRKHVVELQTRLRSLQSNAGSSSTVSRSSAPEVERNNAEQWIAALEDEISYVKMDPEALSQKPTTTGGKGMQKNDTTYKSKYRNDGNAVIQEVPMVDVVAPANLPEGYTFEAEIDNRRFTATVPEGGVRKGQTFSCYMRHFETIASDIPHGQWRDGRFECFKHGVTHPMALNSFFCPLYALSQIMTRLGIDYMGFPDTPQIGVWTASGMIATILVFWILLNTIIFGGLYYKLSRVIPISGADIASFALVNLGMYVYVVYATANTRAYIRERYEIRERDCSDLGDIASAATCMPCVISQMGRHTVSYDDHKGVCCSETGLEPGVEADFMARNHHGSYRLW